MSDQPAHILQKEGAEDATHVMRLIDVKFGARAQIARNGVRGITPFSAGNTRLTQSAGHSYSVGDSRPAIQPTMPSAS